MSRADEDALGRALDDLVPMRLPPSGWDSVGAALRAVDRDDPDAGARVAQVVFEARVQARFRGGRAASTLPPTKQTSALPWVGVVCGGLVLAVGGALGGGAVFVAVAALGLFVFGIALAGSRVAHRRTSAVTGAAPVDAPEPMPPEVADLVRTLRSP